MMYLSLLKLEARHFQLGILMAWRSQSLKYEVLWVLLQVCALAGIVAVMHSCLDLKATIGGKHPHLLYLLAASFRPRMLMTLDEQGRCCLCPCAWAKPSTQWRRYSTLGIIATQSAFAVYWQLGSLQNSLTSY